MAQVTVRDQLKKLVELQKIDKEAFDYKQELKEKPVYLETIKVEFEAKKAGLKSLEDKLKTVQVGRMDKESELKSKEAEIAKANAQLSLLKTNKEYTAKLTEIETIKADKSIIEEKILISYDEADAVQKQMEQEKKLVAEEEKKFLSQKKEIDDAVAALQSKVKELESQRSHLTPDVEKDILARYEKILDKKNGLAIVPIINNVCTGCHMNVPPQTVNDLKMHDKVVICEMCARLLFLEGDL